MDGRQRTGRIAAAALLACAAVAHAQQSTAAAVYRSVAPAVVFVETASGTGSGVLLKSNAILTAAHVVYPHRSARIVFSHGTELLDVPLIGWDLMADVAVLGPVQSEVSPPPISTAAAPAIGSELFTIGYPGEVEPYPQPAISRGVLSRYRHWPDQEITYLQTDALADSGQSGGVLVSADGAVVGMTLFGDFGHFGLAISARDMLTRVDDLLAGEDPAELGDRGWDEPWSTEPISIVLPTYWSEQAFVINAQPEAEVTITARSANDIALAVVDIWGEIIAEADETEQETESVTATLEGTPPFLLIVEQFMEDAAGVVIEADVELMPIDDPDDGVVLQVPARRAAALDRPYDVDHFDVLLRAGETVRIRVDSTAVDPYLTVDYLFSDDVITDDASGGGVFGESAELVLRADGDRTYRVVIDDAYGNGVGGYTLTIEPAQTVTEVEADPPEANGKIYWTDTDGEAEVNGIQRSELDGSNIETLVRNEGPWAFAPYALAIHQGRMYWTDIDQSTIQSVDLNTPHVTDPFGPLVQMIVSENSWDLINSPRGIALSGNHMYWTDLGRIHRSDLSGSGIEVISSERDSYDLAIHDGKIYWTTWSFGTDEGSIERANLDGSDPTTTLVYRSGVRFAGITIHDGKIYWADLFGAIMRSNLDGTGVEDVVTRGSLRTFAPYDIAIFDGKIYWTGGGRIADASDPGRIRRANLDGSQVETLVTGLSVPYGIVVVPN